MDIYSSKGDKVIVTLKGLECGYPEDIEKANKYLKIGEIYTISHMNIQKYRTDLFLEEIQGISFNSVHFENF